MKRYSMLLGWKNQYCENDYNLKCNLQVQCNPYEITNIIFQITRTKNSTIHMETQNTPNSQSSLEKEEWSWRNQSSWLQTILQNRNIRPMDQDRQPRDKPMHLWVTLFAKRGKCTQCSKDSLFNKLKTLNDVNQSNILYDTSLRVMDIGAKINKWDLIKLKSIYTTKETTNKVKRQPSEWENNSKWNNWQRINFQNILSGSCMSVPEKQTTQLKCRKKT